MYGRYETVYESYAVTTSVALQSVLYSAIWMDRIVRMDRMIDDEHLLEVQDKNGRLCGYL